MSISGLLYLAQVQFRDWARLFNSLHAGPSQLSLSYRTEVHIVVHLVVVLAMSVKIEIKFLFKFCLHSFFLCMQLHLFLHPIK